MTTTEMTVGWKALRDAATTAAGWGWPVAPGTFSGPGPGWHGRDGATGLRPIEDTWAEAPVTDPAQAYELWSEHPYSVLLVCGRGVDALEVPRRLRALLPEWVLRQQTPPQDQQVPIVVTTPPSDWLLFTATGSAGLSGALAQAGVCLRGAGSWVALPPTAVEYQCPQRWLVPPRHGSDPWLPESDTIQAQMLAALLRVRLTEGSGEDGE